MEDHEGGLELIKEGWLTKSPADDKLSKFYKPKWRRRYFALLKTSVNHPDAAVGPAACLNYYESEAEFTKGEIKGTIDLDSCEEINSHVETSPHGPAFSIRTLHKRQPRIYRLAADTAEEVEKWIHCLLVALTQNKGSNKGFFNYKITVSKTASAPPTREARSFAHTRTFPARLRPPVISSPCDEILPPNRNFRFLKEEQDSGISSPTRECEAAIPIKRDKSSQNTVSRKGGIFQSSQLQNSLAELEVKTDKTSTDRVEDNGNSLIRSDSRSQHASTSHTIPDVGHRERKTIYPISVSESCSSNSKVEDNPDTAVATNVNQQYESGGVDHDLDGRGLRIATQVGHCESDTACSKTGDSLIEGSNIRFGSHHRNVHCVTGRDRQVMKVISSSETAPQKVSSLTSTQDFSVKDTTKQRGVNNGDIHTRLSCCICMEVFQDPRMLPCGHTFCLCCLTTMQNQAVGRMSCPICNRTCEVDVWSLPKNFIVQDLLDLWAKTNISSPTDEKPEFKEADPKPVPEVAPAVASNIQLHHSKTIELNYGKRITGVSTVDNLVYFVSEYCNNIEVFDMNTSSFLPELPISQLKSPKDISYCVISKCFFIIDSGVTNNCIWKLERTSKTPSKWLIGVAEPHTLSTTASGQLLVLQSDDTYLWNLRMYSTSETTAKQCQSVSLSPAIKCPRHAISQTPDQYFICYGTGHKKEDGHWSVWTVSQVSRTGNIIKSFAMPLVGPLYYITANDNDTLFISEGKAKQIVCIGFQLEQFHLLTNSFGDRKWEPWKLEVSKNNRLLIIGHTTKLCDMFTY